MPDYSLGKVYKIVGNGKVYVGSTTRPLLSQRLTDHRSKYNMWKKGTFHKLLSFVCLEDPTCYIELLESFPCNNIDELHKCEGKWMRDIDCVNRCLAGRTQKEYAESYKDRRKERDKENREKINKYQLVYQREYRARKKLLASNNNLPIDPTNLLIEVESQKANLIVEHE